MRPHIISPCLLLMNEMRTTLGAVVYHVQNNNFQLIVSHTVLAANLFMIPHTCPGIMGFPDKCEEGPASPFGSPRLFLL